MTQPIRILELRSVRGTGGGPEKTILQGAARTDPRRFAVTVCYVRDVRDTVFGIDATASSLPVQYTELIERHSFDLSIWGSLRQLARDKDIVHSHDYKTDLLAWLLSKSIGIPAMSTAHGWTGHSFRERRLYYPFGKRLLARFRRVIAVSSDIKRELIRYGASPPHITTVLNGIDHRQFRRDRSRERAVRSQLGIPADATVVGSIGRLEPQKRFDLLIDAVSRLRANNSRVMLLIAGDGSAKESLARQVSRLAMDDACRLLGHQSNIVDLHHAFDLYVQSSDYEGTPNAVLEAMALETPVVATDVGGTTELIRPGVDGIVVPPDDVEALTRSIAAALTNHTRRAEMADSARMRVETTLSFDTRMETVEAIYVELVAAGRAAASTSAAVSVRT